MEINAVYFGVKDEEHFEVIGGANFVEIAKLSFGEIVAKCFEKGDDLYLKTLNNSSTDTTKVKFVETSV